jgi:hypothetical protein
MYARDAINKPRAKVYSRHITLICQGFDALVEPPMPQDLLGMVVVTDFHAETDLSSVTSAVADRVYSFQWCP